VSRGRASIAYSISKPVPHLFATSPLPSLPSPPYYEFK
jgi:hypothetical protein